MTLVFLDTETTGLHRARRPWEIGIIRRNGHDQTKLHVCVSNVSQECSTGTVFRPGGNPPSTSCRWPWRHTAVGDARWAMRWYDALEPRSR